MLHVMSEVRGWSHEDMMKMPKRIFYRYYGYWYKDRLAEEEEFERRKQEAEQNKKEPDWKPL